MEQILASNTIIVKTDICVLCGYGFVQKEIDEKGNSKIIKNFNQKCKLKPEVLSKINLVLPNLKLSNVKEANGICIKCWTMVKRAVRSTQEAESIKYSLKVARGNVEASFFHVRQLQAQIEKPDREGCKRSDNESPKLPFSMQPGIFPESPGKEEKNFSSDKVKSPIQHVQEDCFKRHLEEGGISGFSADVTALVAAEFSDPVISAISDGCTTSIDSAKRPFSVICAAQAPKKARTDNETNLPDIKEGTQITASSQILCDDMTEKTLLGASDTLDIKTEPVDACDISSTSMEEKTLPGASDTLDIKTEPVDASDISSTSLEEHQNQDIKNEIACRICSEVLKPAYRRQIFSKSFLVLDALYQVLNYCPRDNDGLSYCICVACYAQLTKISKIDFNLKYQPEQLRQKRVQIISHLRGKMKCHQDQDTPFQPSQLESNTTVLSDGTIQPPLSADDEDDDEIVHHHDIKPQPAPSFKDASTQTTTVWEQFLNEEDKTEKVSPERPKMGLTSEKSDETFTLEQVNKSLTSDLHYYTGFNLINLTTLFKFLSPKSEETPVKYKEKCDDIEKVSFFNQLFLVLCRLRQGFDLKDLAFRFNIKPRTVGVIFESLVHYMYLKFTNIPLWKNRQTILENFPISHSPVMCVFGCTELKTLPPLDTDTQSMDCPDYKPNSTLKGLIAIDPRGSISFVSVLFSENISNEKMCKNSGFLGVLAEQKSKGVFADGDFIMTNQESQIKDDLSKIGLCLTQPTELPETGSNNLTSFDTLEQRIEQIQEFKLVGRDIPVSLFSTINEVWFVCALLVNFQNATF